MSEILKTKFYVASKVKHWQMWKHLRNVYGYNIISTWIDLMDNISLDQNEVETRTFEEWQELSDNCIKEAANCDVLILYAENGETLRGAFMEIGAALGSGKKVHVVCETDVELGCILLPHPSVKRFDNVLEAFQAGKV